MKQSDQSKQYMVEALLALMREKPYNLISVKDITEKAGVARLTFYRNFETKEDIIRHHLQIGFDSYMEEVKQAEQLDLKHILTRCYTFWEGQREEILLFSAQNLGWLLREPFADCLQEILWQIGLMNRYSYFQQQFLIGGMFSDMLAWVSDPRGRTPEDMATEILEILKG